jgi:hypothetical protein
MRPRSRRWSPHLAEPVVVELAGEPDERAVLLGRDMARDEIVQHVEPVLPLARSRTVAQHFLEQAVGTAMLDEPHADVRRGSGRFGTFQSAVDDRFLGEGVGDPRPAQLLQARACPRIVDGTTQRVQLREGGLVVPAQVVADVVESVHGGSLRRS